MDIHGAGDGVRQRLLASRWLLVAALAGIALVAIEAGADYRLATGAAAAVVVVAAFAPRRSLRERRAEREAEANKPALGSITAEALAAAVSDPLVIFDSHGAVIHVNGACAIAFPGLSVGTSLQLRFRAPEMQEMIAKALAQGRPVSIDYSEKVPVERFFRVNVSPVGEDGERFVMIFRDQSEIRRIDRMRADFIANASHELRTPLASVSGFIETLRGPAKNDPAAREQFLQIMQAQTARMARLIDDLLSLSRLEMKPYLNPADRVDLKPLIEGVIDALDPLAEDSGVRIHADLGDAPLLVPGNRDELIQVFENLLENACKYGRSGGLVEVLVNRTGQQNGIDVSVRDHGPGIPEEHIPRLTERFYRVDVETSRGQKGTGLGLAIVKHILTRHKARMSVSSRPGEGATFTVHFPPAVG
ncbi:MAG: ATP-binding protein [Mesorhizobium sp.]|nr:ATP-binding protein [Mesorhizobium sp.]MCO5160467.1 ATP-binding protein [Mesorhizobium sp.]